jgi:hypothetical protein
MKPVNQLSDEEFKVVAAAIIRHYNITDQSTAQDVVAALKHSVRNYEQVAREIGVPVELLCRFQFRWCNELLMYQ